MLLPASAQAGVVVGGNGVYHIHIHIIMPGQFQTAPDYLQDMVHPVGGIKLPVTGENFSLYVTFQLWIDGIHNKKAGAGPLESFKNVHFVGSAEPLRYSN